MTNNTIQTATTFIPAPLQTMSGKSEDFVFDFGQDVANIGGESYGRPPIVIHPHPEPRPPIVIGHGHHPRPPIVIHG
jgi:hypothetical protein